MRASFSHVLSLILFCLIAIWFLFQVIFPSARQLTHGYGAYYTASRLLVTGELSSRIYDPDYFRPQVRRHSQGQADDIYNANPPTTTLMFAPLSLLPIRTARLVWTVLNLILLFGGLILLLITFGRALTLAPVLGIFSLSMLFQPVVQNFFFGQAYVLIFFLLCLAAIAFHKQRARVGGIALALALLFKTAGTPLLLLLAWQQRWRYLAWLLVFSLLVLLLTLPLFPLAMWQAYRELLPEATGGPWVCVTAYQTVRSLFCHLFTFQGDYNPTPVAHMPALSGALFFLLALPALAAILIRARQWPTAAFMAVIAWSIVFAPIGEQHHHTIMLLPLVWLLLTPPTGPFARCIWPAAVVVTIVFYLVPFNVNHPGLQQGWRALLAYPRLYGAWLILVFSIYQLWSAGPARPRGGRDHAHLPAKPLL